jgi:hypothetical protein
MIRFSLLDALLRLTFLLSVFVAYIFKALDILVKVWYNMCINVEQKFFCWSFFVKGVSYDS